MLNFKTTLKALFSGQNIVVITEFNEKLGGKLICRPDGTFAIRKFIGGDVPLWPSSMRFIGLDGFDVVECKGADGSSSILLENGLPQQVRDNLDMIKIPIEIDGISHDKDKLIDVREKLRQLAHPIHAEMGKVETALQAIRAEEEAIREAKRSSFFGIRIGDPFDLEDITAARVFNKDRSGSNRLFRRDPYEEFALLQQKSGAIGLLSDFWTVYRIA